uniref:NADPH2:quinone reductase n=1 Tax=Tetraselmis sp. GSL018 TaxID=582737 RepID=A0A061S879_9CHLO
MAGDVTCKAIVCSAYGGPEVLKISTKTIPPPSKGEIRVRICAAGINPSDTYVRLGPSGPYAGTKLLPDLPFTPGKDGAGIVESVGSGQPSRFSPGDRIYLYGSISGTYAEYALCKEEQVFALPSNVSMLQGACMGVPGFTAYRGLFQRCQVKPGEVVLIHGASGAVGLAAVQLAVASGCTVVGTAGTFAGCEAVRAAGAHAVVCHRDEGYVEAARAATPRGEGFDVCLEMMASSNLPSDLGLMKRGGRAGRDRGLKVGDGPRQPEGGDAAGA